MVASSRKGLLDDDIEQSLLEELTASDQSDCSDDDDSSGTDDLTVVDVIGSECSDNESDDVQCATALFCVVLPAGSTTQNKTVITNNSTTIGLFTTDTSDKNLQPK